MKVQVKKKTHINHPHNAHPTGNNGRVIVLGSFGGDVGVARLEECVGEALKLQNQLVLDGSTSIRQVLP